MPSETRHLDFYESVLTLTDKSWQCWALGGYRVRDAIAMTAIASGIPESEIGNKIIAGTVINANSPMRLDIPMGEGLVELARNGQVTVATPFTLAGAMSPVTVVGALVQQNAEALFMVALTQLVRPGAPAIYGGFTSNVDMRTGAPAFGTPEYTKAAMVSGQLARRYRLPYRSSNVNSSNCVDVQAAYESGMSLWGCIMGGVNMVEHAAGWLEGGLTASFEKLIVDAEMLQMMREFLQPLDSGQLGEADGRHRRSRPRRAFLRGRPYARALRDRVLFAAAFRLAQFRNLGRERRDRRHAPRQCDLERVAARAMSGAADGSGAARRARRLCGPAQAGDRGRPLALCLRRRQSPPHGVASASQCRRMSGTAVDSQKTPRVIGPTA